MAGLCFSSPNNHWIAEQIRDNPALDSVFVRSNWELLFEDSMG